MTDSKLPLLEKPLEKREMSDFCVLETQHSWLGKREYPPLGTEIQVKCVWHSMQSLEIEVASDTVTENKTLAASCTGLKTWHRE